MAMNTGTIALKAAAGRTRRRTAPVAAPSAEASAKRSARVRWPFSSRR